MSSEAANIIGLYERHASHWDRDRDRGHPLIEKPWLDRFLGIIPSRASILDLGCGSAEPITRFLIEQGHEVTGVDSSPSLIALCQRKYPLQKWIVADMRTLSTDLRFDDRRFDGILAWHSFFHLCPDDQREMFPRFRALCAANAALLFTSGPSAGEVVGEYRGDPLYHGSLDSAEYRELLQHNGFSVVSHIVADAACGHATVWLAQRIPHDQEPPA